MSVMIEPKISFDTKDTRYIKRGNVWYADMSLALGSEQSGIRPVIVIGNDRGNKFSPNVEVCCITSQDKTKIPTHVDLSMIDFLPRQSIALTEQKRTIDKRRLINYMGTLDKETMEKINEALRISLDL